MLRTKVVRRAARLLGAATVTGVLSLGALSASAGAANACPDLDSLKAQTSGVSHSFSGLWHSQDGNGI